MKPRPVAGVIQNIRPRTEKPTRLHFRDVAWRAAGVGALAVASGYVWMLDVLPAGQWSQPMTIWLRVVQIPGFVVAGLGMMLLVGGSRWHDKWKRDLLRVRSRRLSSVVWSNSGHANSSVDPCDPLSVCGDCQSETASILAYHAIRTAAEAKRVSHPNNVARVD